MDQISSQEVFVKVVEVKITQFVVANLVGKHVIDGDQDFMGYARRDCSLINIESPKDQVVLGCGDIELRAGCHSKFFAPAEHHRRRCHRRVVRCTEHHRSRGPSTRTALVSERFLGCASEVLSVDLCDYDIGMFRDATEQPCMRAVRSPGSYRSSTRPPAGAARALEFF